MPRISAFFTNDGVPLTSPADDPEIRIRRQDTGALVVNDDPMTEQGDGVFTYDFAEDPTLEYVFRCDGDPTVSGQTTALERYVAGSFSGITEARLETDVPAILEDTGTDIPSSLSGIDAKVDGVGADVERLYGENTRSRLWYADNTIEDGVGGALRDVPAGAPSHMEVQVKTDVQADWGSAVTYYVVFNYLPTATGPTDAPASAEPGSSAPTDGTFSVEPYPTW